MAHAYSDGGGIRGYSSLIILRELMRHVRDVETRNIPEEGKKTHSSYDPDEYIPCIRNCHDEDDSTDTAESNRECGECCRYIPAHYFDYIGGTSTGGLIAIMLGRLRMSVQDCMEEYERLSGDIFGHPRLASIRGPIPYWRDKYDGEKIQRAVEDVIKRRMSPEERTAGAGSFNCPRGLCRTVVFAYASKISNDVSEYSSNGEGQQAVDSEDAAPYIFRSYDHWASNPPAIYERNPGYAHNVAIWEAARATTAAPLYFDPIKIGNRKFGDGGFGSNNPAEEMATEVASMHGHDFSCMSVLLSIGTGDMPPIIRIAREDGWLKKYGTYLNAAKKLASDARAVHQRLDSLKKCINPGLPYYRFNVPSRSGLDKIKLDEWKGPKWYWRPSRKRTLDKIREATEAYCGRDEVRAQLMEVAEKMVKHRSTRKTHDLWPLVSRGEQYSVKEDEMEDWLEKGLYPPKPRPNRTGVTNGV
ncbi:hypothetical protein EG328_007419 [Venturia inaequalis]|uniref:PNPLA domain-containing protein n=1 Tax=Venturia inaequalis TaxID=5025 RepID=A0A8H3VTT0_VENIN|nr:hypothetical protein EG328_007419 [Venturia inaequalis]KAE9993427.1 hypothetical protein EG327_005198 [Venturia inaequalis]